MNCEQLKKNTSVEGWKLKVEHQNQNASQESSSNTKAIKGRITFFHNITYNL